ncbi:hypothetical protein GS444_10005 [Rhodococcus hoagii]|nr:hypothetical protein [Prescottella equi]
MSVFAMAAGFAATGVSGRRAPRRIGELVGRQQRIQTTVSNSTPSVGETISITTDFDRTRRVVEYIRP